MEKYKAVSFQWFLIPLRYSWRIRYTLFWKKMEELKIWSLPQPSTLC